MKLYLIEVNRRGDYNFVSHVCEISMNVKYIMQLHKITSKFTTIYTIEYRVIRYVSS